jgi:SecD/SecF fusion protein
MFLSAQGSEAVSKAAKPTILKVATVLAVVLAAFLTNSVSADETEKPKTKVDFDTQIRPILAENCLSCHGPDDDARKAGLRLDTEQNIFGSDHPVIIREKPDDSKLISRISSTDKDEVMPPTASGKTLTDDQKALLEQWIEEGAEWGIDEAPVSGSTVFTIMLVVLFFPHILASFVAKSLKIKEFSSRIGMVLFVLAVAITPFIYQLSSGKSASDCFRLGIDLAGGTNLVYQVDMEKFEESDKNLSQSLDNMVGAITRRVNPSGTEEVTIRRVGSARIEIIIPGKDQAYVEEMKARITRLGTLEFQILATAARKEHQVFIDDAKALPDNENTITRTVMRKDEAGKEIEVNLPVARWVDIDAAATEITAFQSEALTAEIRDIERNGKQIRQGLVALTPPDQSVTGKFLNRATEEMDTQTGRMNVGFQFNAQGADRFGKLTTKYQKHKDNNKYRLAILLDGIMRSAPTILEPIYGQGRITGRFTRDEVQSLVSVLNAGALDVPLIPEPVSEFTISPSLGKTVRTKGITAILVSAVVVVGFMAVYYLKAGLIAVMCLTLNLLLIMGTMVFVQGTFTLPGLAGLVLTIGMAVDANVLIFERIREEIAKGASVRMAIHNGFGKAFSAIIDSNLTTLIVAVILFMIGTDQVKGFAVTLFIGIVMSMFSALYFGRLVFEVLEQKRLLKNLNMFSIVKSPKIDFVGKRRIAFMASTAVILLGLITFVSRGETNLDIDFRGGTMVTFEFEEPRAQTEFKDRLVEQFGADITIEQLTLLVTDDAEAAPVEDTEKGIRWRLRTVSDNVAEVESGIATQLNDLNLKKITVSKNDVTTIEPPKKDDKDETAVVKKSVYDGGSQVEFTFSEQITATTIEQQLIEQVQALENAASFPEPTSLFEIIGTAGEGLNAREGQPKKFDVFLLKFVPKIESEDLDKVLNGVVDAMNSKPLFAERTTFAKSVGGEMQQQAIIAMVTSLIAIVAYIWLRFQRVTFGLAAVAALLHDVLVVLGLMALASKLSGTGPGTLLGFYDFKINLPMIAAFLTIVGYSLNDTIVIFDRIREVRGKNPSLTPEMINTSLNQTLARTLLTSLTTFVVVAILYVAGGEGIHGFAFCLLVGVFVGTYSSIFVASPVLLWLMNREQKTATAS